MVTDKEFSELKNRVDELEKKYLELILSFNNMRIKQEMKVDSQSIVLNAEKDTLRRDTTKYYFEEQVYSKRRLVLACVKKYVQDHPGITGEALSEVFPGYIQGSLGIVRKISEAEQYSNAKARFYFGDDDLLALDDGIYVVCAQWDKKNIDRFLALITDMGYEIEVKDRSY